MKKPNSKRWRLLSATLIILLILIVPIILISALSGAKVEQSVSSFEIVFFDVGEGDAALVTCDGHYMLIDGGNSDDSRLMYAYLEKHNIDYLDYIVCTHAHEDHVGGLSGALHYAKVGKAYCPISSYDTRPFQSFLKCLETQNKQITIPLAGEQFSLGSASVQIIGPIHAYGGENNSSIVLRIQYGNTSFLFTGDAEREEELEILDAGYPLESTLLKVGHHGSSSSTCYPFLKEVHPQYAILSVGENNPYGHPSDDTLSRLRDTDVITYRTDLVGEIVCNSDGNSLSFSFEKQPQQGEVVERALPIDQKPEQESDGQADYILNTNTRRFHYPNCSSVSQMSEKNKQEFHGTREEILDMGYTPCGVCKP